MNTLIQGLLTGWNRNLDYARKLVADIPADEMTFQPHPGMNHPAWVFSHLSLYHPILVTLIEGGSFDDPKNHRFGMMSKPEPDMSIYGSKEGVMACWEEGHDAVEKALGNTTPARLEAPMPLERWKAPFPKVGIVLPYLMLVHESTHLGQLSAWRRVRGLPSV